MYWAHRSSRSNSDRRTLLVAMQLYPTIRLSAGPLRNRLNVSFHPSDHFGWLDGKHLRQAKNGIERRAVPAALEQTYVRTIVSALESEALL